MRKVKITHNVGSVHRCLQDVDKETGINCPMISTIQTAVRCNTACAWFHSYKDWYIYPIDEKYAQREENRCYCGDKLIGELVE